MSTYTIGEVADRSGFSASALRYYEGIGLVAPATRTEAGYRIYDDRTLARLGVHQPGQAAGLLARGDHRSGRDLGRRTLRPGAAPLP